MELRVRPAMSVNGKRYTKQANRFSRLGAGGNYFTIMRSFLVHKTKGN
jgi:hypothetical protein